MVYKLYGLMRQQGVLLAMGDQRQYTRAQYVNFTLNFPRFGPTYDCDGERMQCKKNNKRNK